MATIVYDNVTYTVKYVDPINTPAGDGSTVATALSTLPSTLTNYTCYLIRRTTDEDNLGVDLQRTRNSGKTHIMLLGMPYPDSDLYDQIEQDAKTAWGNDPGIYARIRCNTPTANTTVADGAIFYENSIKTLYCENCYFYRDANGVTAQSYLWSIFYIDGENYTDRSLIWNHCKFSYTQYDLESDDFLANNSTITQNNYSEVKCGSYAYIHSAKNIILKDCIINYVGVWDNYWDYGEAYRSWNRCFYIPNRCDNFLMDGGQINRLNFRSRSGATSQYVPISIERNRQDGICTKSTFRNVTLNLIMMTNTSDCYNPYMIFSQSADVVLENIHCNIKHMRNYNTSSYGMNMNTDNDYAMIWLSCSRNSLRVNGVYMNMENRTDIKISGFPVLLVDSAPVSNSGNPSCCIKNIDFRFPQSIHRNVGCEIFRVERSTYGWMTDNAWSYVRFDDNYRNHSIAFLNNYLITDTYISSPAHTNWGVSIHRVGMKTDTLNCKVFASSCPVQLNSLYNYRSDSRAFRGDYACYLKCGTFTANPSYYHGQRQIDLDGRSAAYITTSNVMPYDENCISSNYACAANCNLICLNTIESGQFFARNPMVFAKSWSSIRTGSTALASLKLYSNVYNNPIYPLCIGAAPYRGLEVTPATLGKKILTVYCARGLFNNSEIERAPFKFWIEAHVPEIQPDETVDYYVTTSFGKMFKTDTSTWSGTTAVTPFKIELPIEVKELTVPIDVKLYYSWYGTSGFVYVDPDIRLTDVIE